MGAFTVSCKKTSTIDAQNTDTIVVSQDTVTVDSLKLDTLK